ncbi:MAG TPA: hypothetical protein VHK63_06920 [Candidatus Limnocylindria bacterium]|nr:hypothetical protein [Candidatus Limnocylindria bacterium]
MGFRRAQHVRAPVPDEGRLRADAAGVLGLDGGHRAIASGSGDTGPRRRPDALLDTDTVLDH